jgi:hypothetical protein
MTHEELTKERNIFLGVFILVALFALLFRTLTGTGIIEISKELELFAGIMTLLSKAVFVYIVYRLSKFLKVSVALTILYCLLTIFSILYLIPFIGLLLKVKSVRKTISESSELVKPTSDSGG